MARIKNSTTGNIGAYSILSTSSKTVFISPLPTKRLEDYEPGAPRDHVVGSIRKIAKTTKTTRKK